MSSKQTLICPLTKEEKTSVIAKVIEVKQTPMYLVVDRVNGGVIERVLPYKGARSALGRKRFYEKSDRLVLISEEQKDYVLDGDGNWL